MQIRRPGVVVEIDECQFGIKIHNRLHLVSDAWSLVVLNEHLKGDCFISNIGYNYPFHKGFLIITDIFKSYGKLDSMYNHLMGICKSLKYIISPLNITNAIDENEEINETILYDFLAELLWRRKTS
ncbi:hypothetical protein RF11_08633 [Thelohanellus kitauei]|uniref:Uncharacterized protein n=1 Tax=Thelohanellus kitauei TaxID=669202 RepID=A0A0C2IU75_THEKT|nr:hypothetical protein RF11_08633 [Thelohanellus kitauei]